MAPDEVLPPRAEPVWANEMLGVSAASPGLAVGKVVQFCRETIDIREADEGIAPENGKLEALSEAHRQIDALKGQLTDAAKAKILDAHQEMPDDPLLRERVNDIRDVGRRVLATLAGVQPGRIETPRTVHNPHCRGTHPPSETTSLDLSKVPGFCTHALSHHVTATHGRTLHKVGNSTESSTLWVLVACGVVNAMSQEVED